MKTTQILVYGPGCAWCTTLAENVKKAAQELPGDFEITKVSNPAAIADAGIFQTPALAVNGKILVNGRVPSVSELKAMLRNELAAEREATTGGQVQYCDEKTAPQWKELLWIVGIFALVYFFPADNASFRTAMDATLNLVQWYAREHVILCLLPAFFIAGIIAVFVSKDAVLRYLGAGAPRWLSYTVASVSGGILSVCSCTVLPLFSGIYKRGAGLGPAMAFLYSGPAISILSVILTSRILGWEMGLVRTCCAMGLALIVGGLMALGFRHDKLQNMDIRIAPATTDTRTHVPVLFLSLVAVLVFANWAPPQETDGGIWHQLYCYRWFPVAVAAMVLGLSLRMFLRIPAWKVVVSAAAVVVSLGVSLTCVTNPVFVPHLPMLVALAALVWMLLTDKEKRNRDWALSSWDFTKQTMPLMALGIVVTGMLLGASYADTNIPGLIPANWVQQAVGGNDLGSTFFASFAGAFMYFSTLTEIPIVQGMMSAGMGKGPALALLLAGPSLSLPNMLVISGVLGWRKTIIYVSLVIALSTICGFIYGNLL